MANGGTPVASVERRVRLAAILICLRLVVLLFTLMRVHPLAFIAFILIGCPLVLGGYCYFRIPSFPKKPRLTSARFRMPRPPAECSKPQLPRVLVPPHPFSKQTSRLLTGEHAVDYGFLTDAQ